MQTQNTQNRRAGAGRRTEAGFTLLELVVTMMVSALVVLAAYQLFASTSEAMYEANSLSDTTDRARFGLELIARDVRAAGAFGTPEARGTWPMGTPESHGDFFVNKNQLGDRNIRGIYPFATHQARQIGDVQAEWNRATRSDQLVLLGAYDFPFSFEVTFLGGDTFDTAFAENTNQGAMRFNEIDPFVVNTPPSTDLGPLQTSIVNPIASRILRVTDRNGFAQFVAIDSATYAAGVNNGLTLNLDNVNWPLQPRIETPVAGENPRAGLEPGGEEDVAYEAALLDAYRYRVCAPVATPNRLRLVRERIDARALVENNVPEPMPGCQDEPIGPGNFIIDQQLIVDRVADFQIWYDCARPGSPTMEIAPWVSTWETPGFVTDPEAHGCLFVDSGTGDVLGGLDPSQARMAHIRLSVHTERERSDVSNYGFLRADGSTANTSNAINAPLFINSVDPIPADVVGHLQTFDLNGDAANAARVVTMQVDVQLTNYINRAVLRQSDQSAPPIP